MTMTPEQWQQIEDILDEVMPLDTAQRAARLDQLCHDDTTLRSQVEEMMVFCEQVQADAFLEDPPHLAAQDLLGSILVEEPGVDLKAGTAVGPYTILEPLGRGGMGEVFLAERANPHRRVALKIVKRGMDTREILQRFRYEREILARLNHPNIAQLYGGDATEDGRPYFAMEYVEGQPLDAYCDDKNLSISERLALFKTVCEAVRYAHRNLVVHRDLKPGNILVTEDEAGQPLVKLLDFGIAKLLEEDASLHTVPMTGVGERRMTPSYAAPEQIRGQHTTPATDVYALGVILYRLLTGRRPYYFEDRSVTVLESVICDTMPDRPSTVVVRAIRSSGDGAPETTPEALGRQRAASPKLLRRQLSGDLDAITMMALRKEPERRYASAAEFFDDIQRYLDNHPVIAQSDSVTYRTAKFIRRHKIGVVVSIFAFFALIGTGAATWKANQAAQQVRQEAERANVTLGVIGSMLEKVNPDLGQGATFTARNLIDAGLSEIDALENQPRAQATMMNELGRLSLSIGLDDVADSLHREALDIQSRELGPKDPDRAESLVRLADVYARQDKPEEAELTYKQAIEANPRYGPAHTNLGIFYYNEFRFDDAIPTMKRYIKLVPDDAQGYNNLGAAYYQLERWAEAAEMWERTIALDSLYEGAYSNLAFLYNDEGRYAEAARMFQKAVEVNDRDYKYWGYLAAAHYWTPGGRDKAPTAYQQAIEIAEEILREVNPNDKVALSRLATYHAMIGEEDIARRYIERALDLAPEDQEVMFEAGATYEQLGEREVALHWIGKALADGHPQAYIERDPAFRELIADPRYQQILQDSSDVH